MPTQSHPLTERDYLRVESARKESLAQLIRRSGLSISHISRRAKVGRHAVRRAISGEGIQFCTAVRIEYYLQWYLNGGSCVEKEYNADRIYEEEKR